MKIFEKPEIMVSLFDNDCIVTVSQPAYTDTTLIEKIDKNDKVWEQKAQKMEDILIFKY